MVDWISDGDGGPEEDEEPPPCSSLLIVLSAELNALSSDELMVPADTSDVSWFCSMVRGDGGMPFSDDIEDMGNSSTSHALREATLRLMEPCSLGSILFPYIANSKSGNIQKQKSQPPRLLALIQSDPCMPHILFVEDDAEISRLVGRYLRAADFRVSILPDGRKIERALEDSRVDLILLDLMLPGEDGLSLCRRLRTHSGVPIIMVTAKGDELDRIVGLEMGADDYLSKPFNPRELLARIRAVLRRAGAARRAPNGLVISPFPDGGSIAWFAS